MSPWECELISMSSMSVLPLFPNTFHTLLAQRGDQNVYVAWPSFQMNGSSNPTERIYDIKKYEKIKKLLSVYFSVWRASKM